MSDYHSRKALRSQTYTRHHGVKMVSCSGCTGTGRDADDGLPCYWCKGTGKVEGPLNRLSSDPVPEVHDWRAKLKRQEQLRTAKKQIHALAS